MQTFKNIKSAHEHFKFPGSYRHGTVITNNLAIRIYSNMISSPDILNKNKTLFYYVVKTPKRLQAFKNNKKENIPIDIFIKQENEVLYLGKYKVLGFRQSNKYVVLKLL